MYYFIRIEYEKKITSFIIDYDGYIDFLWKQSIQF